MGAIIGRLERIAFRQIQAFTESDEAAFAKHGAFARFGEFN